MLKKILLFILISFNVFSIDYFDYPDYKFNFIVYENEKAFEKPAAKNYLILDKLELQRVYDELDNTLVPVSQVTISDLKNQLVKYLNSMKEWGKTNDLLLFWVGRGYRRPATLEEAKKEKLSESLKIKDLYKNLHYRPYKVEGGDYPTVSDDELYLYAIRKND